MDVLDRHDAKVKGVYIHEMYELHEQEPYLMTFCNQAPHRLPEIGYPKRCGDRYTAQREGASPVPDGRQESQQCLPPQFLIICLLKYFPLFSHNSIPLRKKPLSHFRPSQRLPALRQINSNPSTFCCSFGHAYIRAQAFPLRYLSHTLNIFLHQFVDSQIPPSEEDLTRYSTRK